MTDSDADDAGGVGGGSDFDWCKPQCSELEVRSDGGHECVDCGGIYWYHPDSGFTAFTPSEWAEVLEDEFGQDDDERGASSDEPEIELYDMMDGYGIQYNKEYRHGNYWIQIEACSELYPHVVKMLREEGYRLHSFASDSTMNFEKVEDERSGVRSAGEIREKLKQLREDDMYGLGQPDNVIRRASERKALEWALWERDTL